jgi:hypothetical protein
MANHLFLVFSDPVEGCDAAYNTWYDRHVQDILRLPGFVAAQRLIKRDVARSTAVHEYLTVYEIDGEPEDAIGGLRQAVIDKKLENPDPTCVAPKLTSYVYTPVTKRFTRVDV